MMKWVAIVTGLYLAVPLHTVYSTVTPLLTSQTITPRPLLLPPTNVPPTSAAVNSEPSAAVSVSNRPASGTGAWPPPAAVSVSSRPDSGTAAVSVSSRPDSASGTGAWPPPAAVSPALLRSLLFSLLYQYLPRYRYRAARSSQSPRSHGAVMYLPVGDQEETDPCAPPPGTSLVSVAPLVLLSLIVSVFDAVANISNNINNNNNNNNNDNNNNQNNNNENLSGNINNANQINIMRQAPQLSWKVRAAKGFLRVVRLLGNEVGKFSQIKTQHYPFGHGKRETVLHRDTMM